jgi:hypothetical protein
MIILLIIAAWTVVLSLVAGLCAAARLGDVGLLTRARAPVRPGQTEPLAWERAEHFEITARANVAPQPEAASDGSLLRTGDLAA